jgi:hypothetical protein
MILEGLPPEGAAQIRADHFLSGFHKPLSALK